MIKAQDLAKISLGMSEYSLPEAIFEHLEDVARCGLFTTKFYVQSELARPLKWSEDKDERLGEICKFKRYMESLGYGVTLLHPWGDGTRPVDSVQISW